MSSPSPKRLVLASRSPSRARQLLDLGYAFEQAAPPFDDPLQPTDEAEVDAATLARRLAVSKARSLAAVMDGDVVILAADTIVVDPDGALVGTPGDATTAGTILRRLFGRDHTLLSGAAVTAGDRLLEAHDTAVIRIEDPGEAALQAYLEAGRWVGLAGGYHLEALRSLGWRVAATRDDVGGLPMRVVRPMLDAVGVVGPEVAPEG